MSQKLFRVAESAVSEIPSRSSRIERDLQTLFEQHLDSFLGIRFLVTEYSTGADHVLVLGDDVRRVETKTYYAFKRLRNFACTKIAPTKQVTIFLKLDSKTVDLEEGFTRDMTGRGHQGTGDLEIAVKSEADLEKADPLLERAYAGT